MPEKTYTLEEARRELARLECVRDGHDWLTVVVFGGHPVAVTCNRCGRTHEVIA